MALVRLGSDIQQPDPGQIQAQPHARIGSAHQRIAQQVDFIGAHIGAGVQQELDDVLDDGEVRKNDSFEARADGCIFDDPGSD